MQPDAQKPVSPQPFDPNTIYPPIPGQPTPTLTGSQLAAQNMASRDSKSKRKVIIITSVIIVLVLAGAVTGLLASLKHKPLEEAQSTPAAAPKNFVQADTTSTKATTYATQFKDTSLSMGGVNYRLKFFMDGVYQLSCVQGVTKPCEGIYTSSDGRPRTFLAIMPAYAGDSVGVCSGQETNSFAFTDSAGESAEACETGQPNHILYYNTIISLSGKKYRINFIGETKTGTPYSDISGYKEDLKTIFPSIALAM